MRRRSLNNRKTTNPKLQLENLLNFTFGVMNSEEFKPGKIKKTEAGQDEVTFIKKLDPDESKIFDTLTIVTTDADVEWDYIFSRKKEKPVNVLDIQILTDEFVEMLGIDDKSKGNFTDQDLNVIELKRISWEGRQWIQNNDFTLNFYSSSEDGFVLEIKDSNN